MTIATVDDIVAGLANGKTSRFSKQLTAPQALGRYHSAWMASGWPVAGSAPPAYNAGAGYPCNKDTVGAMQLQNAAVQLWLAKLFASASQPGVIILYDRLWSCSGIGFGASTYTITTPGSLPPRITDNGIGAELWIEQFVAAGNNGGCTVTANYLNTDNAAKSGVLPSTSLVASPVAGHMQQIPLAAGDLGISQLTSLTLSSTWTSGSLGLTILKPICEIPIFPVSAGSSIDSRPLDWALLGLPKIPNDACLAFMYLASSTTAPIIMGSATLIDK